MPNPPTTLRSLCLLALAGAPCACALGDLFQAAGPGDVQFVWVGDTVATIGTATPFTVTLVIDGVPANTPTVQVAIPDTTVIAFGATPDSIVGRRPGNGDVVAWIETSLAARIDTVFRIRSRP